MINVHAYADFFQTEGTKIEILPGIDHLDVVTESNSLTRLTQWLKAHSPG